MIFHQLVLLAFLSLSSFVSSESQVFESIDAAPESVVQGKATACPEPKTALGSGQVNWLTKLHNIYRRKPWAANMREMQWGWTISRRAQALANTCVFQHGMLKDCSDRLMGQNLYAAWGSSTPKLSLTKAVDKWFQEHNNYNVKTGECSGVCGHYTQVVWAESNRVGCGYAECPVLTIPGKPSVKNAVLFVCNYLVPGNRVGAAPFVRAARCSKCPKGTTCKDNLCATI